MDGTANLRIALVLCVAVAAMCPIAHAQFGGGTGEPNDPYLIYTPEQMNAIGADPNCWDKHFKLCADLDLSAYTGDEFNIIGARPLLRRGNPSDFTGVFDGDGHTISNFTCITDDTYYVGLFRSVAGVDAGIKNVTLMVPDVSAMSVDVYCSVGSLVGYLHGGTVVGCRVIGGRVSGPSTVGGLIGANEGTVSDCSVADMDVTGQSSVGGLAGGNRGTLVGCASTADVFGSSLVGGLVGANGGTIRACWATGDVTGDECEIGGLVGGNGGTIVDCLATGDVTGELTLEGGGYDYAIGGLIGSDWDGSLVTSFATGNVAGRHDVGGLVGFCWQTTSVLNCYANGSVTGDSSVGGLVGALGYSSLTNCYSTGCVTGDSSAGGLVGYNNHKDNPVIGCFWDIETSGQATSAVGTGRTAADMQIPGTFLSWGDGAWTIDAGNDYPRLQWEKRPGAPIEGATYPTQAGTVEDPILIHTAAEMALIGWVPSKWDKHFRLCADIDMAAFTGSSYCIIGTDSESPFTGVFDGDGHTISNFSYRSSNMKHVGLFGYVSGVDAEIKNLGMIDPNVEAGHFGYVGAIAGYLSYATIRRCYAEGGTASGGDYYMSDVRGSDCITDSVGGLVGRIGHGRVLNCYATTDVYADGWYSGGGIAGSNSSGTITNVYSTGMVLSEENSPGGLVDYSTSRSAVTVSFWDIETSGLTTSGGGDGLTTAQMQDVNTFLQAGWDFVGESSNGTAQTWLMPASGGYPQLSVFHGYEPLPPEGQGTSEEPFLITGANDLGYVTWQSDACYRLECDIDLSDIVWTVPVVPQFGGHFDGNGHVIHNLDIEGGGHLGLFGHLGSTGIVVDLGLDEGSLQGGGYHIGALVGYSSGCVLRCRSKCVVAGGDDVGGLIGRNSGSVSDCYSAGSVLADYYCIGGLIGRTYHGAVVNCYSTASAPDDGPRFIGGLVGVDLSDDVLNCFWDTPTGSPRPGMMMARTFVDAGWDFVGETENGTEDIWWIDEGRDYPRLWWEAGD